jgi:RNA polymerase sigma-70 factor (ECF subfamily)
MPNRRLSRDGREDARLVKRCRQGDTGAFETLVRKYQDPVFSIAYRMVGDREEARDLAQETFISAFEGIRAFDARRSFRAWLYRIAANASIDQLRRGGKSRGVPVRIAVGAGDSGTDQESGGVVIELPGPEAQMPENVSISNETSRLVWEALEELPGNYRAVVVLHHMEGMSYAQTGRVLGVPGNTAKTWGRRAGKLLCESLEGVV